MVLEKWGQSLITKKKITNIAAKNIDNINNCLLSPFKKWGQSIIIKCYMLHVKLFDINLKRIKI